MVFGIIKKLTGKDKDLVKEGNILFSKCEYKKALMKYREVLEINIYYS